MINSIHSQALNWTQLLRQNDTIYIKSEKDIGKIPIKLGDFANTIVYIHPCPDPEPGVKPTPEQVAAHVEQAVSKYRRTKL